MQHDALEQVAEGKIQRIGERLQHLEQPLCHADAGLGALDDYEFGAVRLGRHLRHLDHRNAALHAEAMKTSTKLSKSADPSERRVGKDALRDITRPAVLKKVAAKR